MEPDASHVLVVEDKPSVLKLMATVLGEQYRVTTCSSGEEAVAILGSGPVDVVLTDIRMPGASGFEVLRSARLRWPPPAVVMMTAYANVAGAGAAMRQGAFDYVAKPLDADEIALVVDDPDAPDPAAPAPFLEKEQLPCRRKSQSELTGNT